MHTVYGNNALSLALPANATRSQTLYAPTTRGPNGSCLEMGTNYTRDVTSSVTSSTVYVFNFCKSPMQFVKEIPVTADFLATYGQGSIGGIAAYAISIFSLDKIVSDEMTWYAEIYNYKNKTWDLLLTTKGYYSGDFRGWSIFETWYRAGQCSPTLPVLTVALLKYLNIETGQWEPVQSNMTQLQNSLHAGGDCFVENITPASYVVTQTSVDSWKVSSSGK